MVALKPTTAGVASLLKMEGWSMLHEYKLFIGGEWNASSTGATFPAMNPFNQQIWAIIPEAGDPDVQSAVAAARDLPLSDAAAQAFLGGTAARLLGLG